MMVIAVGLSSYNVALFHLVNHAFYKALLFLGAGAVIHAVADNQDFRKYGGLRQFLPLTYSVMLIASLSLVAFPFMTGFYSKDFILESAYGQFYFSGTVVYFIATIGAMFTTLYSVKVLYLTFLSKPNGPMVNYKQPQAAHEGDIFMSMPLIILAVFSIFFGYLTKDIFIGLASGFFSDNSLFIHPLHEIILDTEFAVPTLFKLLPLFFTISLSLISLFVTEFYPKLLFSFKFSNFGYNIFSFFNQRFLVELFYNKYVSGILLKLGGQTTKVMDKGLVESIGPYGLERNLTNLSISINNLTTGVVTSYALYILIGLISYLCVLYYSNFVEDFLELLLLILLCLINSTKNNKSWKRLSPLAKPQLLVLQSSVCIISGLTIFFGAGFNVELSGLINSLSNLAIPDTKYTPKFNLMNAIVPIIAGAYDYLVYTLPNINTQPQLFSDEFMASHLSIYGDHYNYAYFVLLRQLYEEYQSIAQWHQLLQVNYSNLTEYFTINLLSDFLIQYGSSDNFSEVMAAFTRNPGFCERLAQLLNYTQEFRTTLHNYNTSITITNNLLQQIQTVNPNFSLPNPQINPILVTPSEWFIVQSLILTDINWDPHIFTLSPLNSDSSPDFLAIVGDQNIEATRQRYLNYLPSRVSSLNFSPNLNFLHPFDLVEDSDSDLDPNQDQDQV